MSLPPNGYKRGHKKIFTHSETTKLTVLIISKMTSKKLVLLFVIAGIAICAAEFTQKEKDALSKFRKMVKPLLLEEYMSSDIYLIPWLRAKNFNLGEAKEMLAKAMQWRKDNKMDRILKEDYTKFRREYPVFFEGVDKDGRPITTYLFGQYDLRKASLAGESDKLKRYISRIFEVRQKRIREINNPDKVNSTIALFDLNGFNRREHLCLQCLDYYIHLTNTYENYYPQLTHKTYFLNIPTLFEQVLNAVRPLFSEHTRNTIYFFDNDKEKWRKELLKQIPSNELFRQFGGSKIVKGSGL